MLDNFPVEEQSEENTDTFNANGLVGTESNATYNKEEHVIDGLVENSIQLEICV